MLKFNFENIKLNNNQEDIKNISDYSLLLNIYRNTVNDLGLVMVQDNNISLKKMKDITNSNYYKQEIKYPIQNIVPTDIDNYPAFQAQIGIINIGNNDINNVKDVENFLKEEAIDNFLYYIITPIGAAFAKSSSLFVSVDDLVWFSNYDIEEIKKNKIKELRDLEDKELNQEKKKQKYLLENNLENLKYFINIDSGGAKVIFDKLKLSENFIKSLKNQVKFIESQFDVRVTDLEKLFLADNIKKMNAESIRRTLFL